MPKGTLPHDILNWKPQGTRPRGRPENLWGKSIGNLLHKIGKNVENWLRRPRYSTGSHRTCYEEKVLFLNHII